MAKAHHVNKEGTVRYMYWMKARDIPHYEAPYQKVGIPQALNPTRMDVYAYDI
jgi:hypothetical protein